MTFYFDMANIYHPFTYTLLYNYVVILIYLFNSNKLHIQRQMYIKNVVLPSMVQNTRHVPIYPTIDMQTSSYWATLDKQGFTT